MEYTNLKILHFWWKKTKLTMFTRVSYIYFESSLVAKSRLAQISLLWDICNTFETVGKNTAFTAEQTPTLNGVTSDVNIYHFGCLYVTFSLFCLELCTDHHANCEIWAKQGVCKRDADYMSRNCRRACHFCWIV